MTSSGGGIRLNLIRSSLVILLTGIVPKGHPPSLDHIVDDLLVADEEVESFLIIDKVGLICSIRCLIVCQ